MSRSRLLQCIAIVILGLVAYFFISKQVAYTERLEKRLLRTCPNESVEGLKKMETHEYHKRTCIIYGVKRGKPVKMVCQYHYAVAERSK